MKARAVAFALHPPPSPAIAAPSRGQRPDACKEKPG
ncbi:hypothetical protein R2601_04378 [Salipiger bermudensis HTCC2601]|uniref:Uncharacterized protein n=1 Tax=Salipiger bermudensis (strain DSM 26914 / JCM 13377 / KCTC 12554 / HTCC2601) TaxID=314265 RepID=Q0FVX0_SALBH|nr:hypothetical protein R2601_04378 [Salipiger bermudensis HTCC2601]